MNLLILKGNLGSDPDIRIFESGGQVAKFSLATTERYINKAKEKVESVDWHNIVFYGNVVDTIEKYLHKGDQVLITGKVKYRNYKDKDDKTIWVTEVIGGRFEFCGSPQKQEEKPAEAKPEKWQGKTESGAMSNIDELPDHIAEQQEASENIDDMPY
jgi:single-strand DNA-binding protein